MCFREATTLDQTLTPLEQVSAALDTLTPREAAVIKMRYGLEDCEEHTLAAIGEALSLTRERVRQIEADALRKMREGTSAAPSG